MIYSYLFVFNKMYSKHKIYFCLEKFYDLLRTSFVKYFNLYLDEILNLEKACDFKSQYLGEVYF